MSNPLKSNHFGSDSNGYLVAINNLKDIIPFNVKRIFYVYDVPKNQTRGCHAHFEDKQLLICVKGSINVKLDWGHEERTFLLKQNDSIFMDNMVWGEQTYLTGNDILLALCSKEHDETDYIKDYSYFIKERHPTNITLK